MMADQDTPAEGQDAQVDHAAAEQALAASGMQVQKIGSDEAAEAVTQASEDRVDPGPTARGLATPMHREPSREQVLQRLSPDPGRGGTRIVLTTSPVIGPVEGHIPMPDVSTLTAFPWAQMGVSDSFSVGYGVTKEELQEAADQWASENNAGAKFVAHQMGDGVRIWRTV